MDNTSCILFNTLIDGNLPDEFRQDYHVHILVNSGTMTFSDGKDSFKAGKNDLVIWQMSNTIQNVSYSRGFDADVLLASPQFLTHYNPEMTWATRGFLFIRQHPSFHLHGESLRIIRNDFLQFCQRLDADNEMFKIELLGNQMRMFLYDMWVAYSSQMEEMRADDNRTSSESHQARLDGRVASEVGLANSSQIFLRFCSLVQEHCRKRRDVAFYADQLCITPKYLSQVSNKVTNVSALQWINYYAGFELVSLLDNPRLTIQDIAYDMDFSSPNHFTRYCRKVLGMTPTEYRNRQQRFQ